MAKSLPFNRSSTKKAKESTRQSKRPSKGSAYMKDMKAKGLRYGKGY